MVVEVVWVNEEELLCCVVLLFYFCFFDLVRGISRKLVFFRVNRNDEMGKITSRLEPIRKP